MTEMFKLTFTDMLNQTTLGGTFQSFEVAMSNARRIIVGRKKSSFKISRTSDGIVLAQSKAAQS